MPNQFHSLLASTTQTSLLKNLDLSSLETASLVNAEKEIRRAIIDGFASLREEVRRKKLDHEVPKPRFAIQGSYAYGTLNAPANPPKQQVDIDLGMYLPFSALGDGQQPKTATEYYFSAITRILVEYITTNRKPWVIPPEKEQKDTCIRVILNEKTHIDIPLYAVPEGELDRVTEAQLASLNKQDYAFANAMDQEFALEAYTLEAVSPDVIHMAHRKAGWQPSDALVIRDWVKSNFQKMGKMIRPINRFLKAWRDHMWPDGGGPSSIFLLAHSLRSFPSDPNGLTHCEALEAVINELPNVFERPLLIPCPTSSDKNAKEDLNQRIDADSKTSFLIRFIELRNQYRLAKGSTPELANLILIKLFGSRLPYAPMRIEMASDVPAKVKEITNDKPEVRPLYTTDRSTSG